MIDIAVLGLGTVGNGVYEVIAGNGPHIARSLGGEALRIKRVLDLRTFDTHPLRGVVTNDFACILGDPDIRVVVETMGGLHPAYEFSKAALESGRSVVTSNKAVVEEYGRELTETARQNGVYYLYEAAVGGGIPLISTLHGSFGANGIRPDRQASSTARPITFSPACASTGCPSTTRCASRRSGAMPKRTRPPTSMGLDTARQDLHPRLDRVGEKRPPARLPGHRGHPAASCRNTPRRRRCSAIRSSCSACTKTVRRIPHPALSRSRAC